jgi:hypothetical protein
VTDFGHRTPEFVRYRRETVNDSADFRARTGRMKLARGMLHLRAMDQSVPEVPVMTDPLLPDLRPARRGPGRDLTLLDLVRAIAESAKSEAEIVATVTSLINSGRVTLVGHFRGADVKIA